MANAVVIEQVDGLGLRDMGAVAEAFNRPRAVLGLRLIPVRIGIATGTVSIGKIGPIIAWTSRPSASRSSWQRS